MLQIRLSQTKEFQLSIAVEIIEGEGIELSVFEPG
jgi:hypothetical protein